MWPMQKILDLRVDKIERIKCRRKSLWISSYINLLNSEHFLLYPYAEDINSCF